MSNALSNSIFQNSIPNTKPTRALIGWLVPSQANQLISGTAAASAATLEFVSSAISAANSSINRVLAPELEEPSKEVTTYGRQLLSADDMENVQREGWVIKMVDLKHVISAQPFIGLNGWDDILQATTKTTDLDIARITLPQPSTVANANVSMDASGRSLVVTSDNPNLKIAGVAISPDGSFGFTLKQDRSFVQVAKVGDRYILRDGHHRAYALFRRGVTRIPCLYREFASIEDMGLPPGTFAPSILRGSSPPLLKDFFDDRLAVTFNAPISKKVVVISAVETLIPA